MRIVEPNTLPRKEMTIKEIAAAKAAGCLTIHDNGVLTVQVPGEPEYEVQCAKAAARKPDKRYKLNGYADHSAGTSPY